MVSHPVHTYLGAVDSHDVGQRLPFLDAANRADVIVSAPRIQAPQNRAVTAELRIITEIVDYVQNVEFLHAFFLSCIGQVCVDVR